MQGFRPGGTAPPGTSTAWPSGLTIAASWDVDAVFEWGAGMGKEFYDKGANVQLGPAVCIARLPLNGRNFEYMSGESAAAFCVQVHNFVCKCTCIVCVRIFCADQSTNLKDLVNCAHGRSKTGLLCVCGGSVLSRWCIG